MLCDGLDVPASLRRYQDQVADLLGAVWTLGETKPPLDTDEIEIMVRISEFRECSNTIYEVLDEDDREKPMSFETMKAIRDSYDYARARVWARGKWAVMEGGNEG
jgi:hypothetical protein